ncbi:MAG TPA: hypothetical protein DCE29_01470 [Alteromonas macleodii]|nr:hypothetical protein [Alteromonas macleodii]HAM17928.1 hypothetical protein [Alteromonas macleodii]|tara:strand:- start:51 stop:350 length:300 start_codon:yes stop_codon:yes gene_type:complete
MKGKHTKILSQNINLRLTRHDFHKIAQEAEDKGIGKADVLRLAWREYLHQKEVNLLLSGLEKRLTRKTFEIVSIIAGLDESERLNALQMFRKRVNQEYK